MQNIKKIEPYLFRYSFRVGRSILEIQWFTAKLQTLKKTAGPLMEKASKSSQFPCERIP